MLKGNMDLKVLLNEDKPPPEKRKISNCILASIKTKRRKFTPKKENRDVNKNKSIEKIKSRKKENKKITKSKQENKGKNKCKNINVKQKPKGKQNIKYEKGSDKKIKTKQTLITDYIKKVSKKRNK